MNITFLIGKFVKIIKYISAFGLIKGFNILVKLYLNKNLITLAIPQLKYPIKLRGQTTDTNIFEQIFLYKEYNFPISIVPKLIIDGGAYTGYSTVFFANKFPNATIIAVEPESSNFALLKLNAKNYSNIILINSAIWNRKAHLIIEDPGSGKWGYQVKEVPLKEKFSFESVSIAEIMSKQNIEQIDILKLDIEGSEIEVFSSGYENWLGKVNVMIIELHDKIRAGCSEVFQAAIGNYRFNQFQRGDSIILMKY